MAGTDITAILNRWAGGDGSALDDLVPLVYNDLRKLAASKLRNDGANRTLQTTALVHEIYLRLSAQVDPDLHSRGEFFYLAATLMRRVLVDYARRRRSAKRGGGEKPAEFDETFMAPDTKLEEWIAVDEALDQFAVLDPRRARVVELRYFAGFSTDEIAALMNSSPATLRRDWAVARTWLSHHLGERKHGPGKLGRDQHAAR